MQKMEINQNKVEFEKIFLENNVMPSIKSTVKNRYLIISAATAYYAFVLEKPEIFNRTGLLVTIGLSVFTLLNFFNYDSNKLAQRKILDQYQVDANGKYNINCWFTGVILILLLVAFTVIRCSFSAQVNH